MVTLCLENYSKSFIFQKLKIFEFSRQKISLSNVMSFLDLRHFCWFLNTVFGKVISNGLYLFLIFDLDTLFENSSNCRIWIFEFWHFPPIFILLKLTCLVTLFDRKLQVFKNLSKLIFFDENVNLARFARIIEWDFFCDFQTLCVVGETLVDKS